jgi:hypothetical protein
MVDETARRPSGRRRARRARRAPHAAGERRPHGRQASLDAPHRLAGRAPVLRDGRAARAGESSGATTRRCRCVRRARRSTPCWRRPSPSRRKRRTGISRRSGAATPCCSCSTSAMRSPTRSAWRTPCRVAAEGSPSPPPTPRAVPRRRASCRRCGRTARRCSGRCGGRREHHPGAPSRHDASGVRAAGRRGRRQASRSAGDASW